MKTWFKFRLRFAATFCIIVNAIGRLLELLVIWIAPIVILCLANDEKEARKELSSCWKWIKDTLTFNSETIIVNIERIKANEWLDAFETMKQIKHKSEAK